MTVVTHKKFFNSNFVEFGLHVSYRGPIYDNGTSNALLTAFMTELSTRSWLKKYFLVENG